MHSLCHTFIAHSRIYFINESLSCFVCDSNLVLIGPAATEFHFNTFHSHSFNIRPPSSIAELRSTLSSFLFLSAALVLHVVVLTWHALKVLWDSVFGSHGCRRLVFWVIKRNGAFRNPVLPFNTHSGSFCRTSSFERARKSQLVPKQIEKTTCHSWEDDVWVYFQTKCPCF